jgi:mono/diheme cytochrome c family protein
MRLLIIISVLLAGLFACSPYNPVTMAGTPNPLPNTPEVVNAGQDVFKQRCVGCHGSSGRGDGPAATGLPSRPANLRLLDGKLEGLIAMRIARGGNGMPAWEGVLKDEEIWQLTRYIKHISSEEVAAYASAH